MLFLFLDRVIYFTLRKRSAIFLILLALVGTLQAGEALSDIWVISGQSNACGRAELPGYEEHALAKMFDGRAWVPAKEPLPLGGTVGPWLAAATETAKAGIEVKITGWASGGQPITIWEESGGGWKSLNAKVHAAGKNAGVFLWYQGESDAAHSMTLDDYGKRLTDLVARVRKEAANPAMQVVIVQLSKFGSGKASTMDIREAQRQVVLKDAHALLVTAMGRDCDGVHLRKDGYFELGREISRALLKTRYGKKDVDWPGPVLDAAALGADGKTVCMHFAEVKKLAGVLAADFGAVDSDGQVKCVKAQAENTRVMVTLERAVKLPAKMVYGFGHAPLATLVDEGGNRAPAVMLELVQAPQPADQPSASLNGASAAPKPPGKK